MYSTTRRNYQIFLGALLILSLALPFFPAGVAHATTVTPGYVAPDEDLIGVRFKSFANTGDKEIYVGVPNLGDPPRAQTDIVWASGPMQ